MGDGRWEMGDGEDELGLDGVSPHHRGWEGESNFELRISISEKERRERRGSNP